MIKKGHKNIGVITGKSNSIHTQQRLIGYQRALFDNSLLYNPTTVCEGNWVRESGYELTDTLLDQGVTAIFCMNDLMAGGVYDRLLELNLKPGDDISVAGYDDREMSRYYKPQLSTAKLPLRDIGYKASEIMMDMLKERALKDDSLDGELTLNDNQEAKVYSIPCYPMIRNSVKRLS